MKIANVKMISTCAWLGISLHHPIVYFDYFNVSSNLYFEKRLYSFYLRDSF
jgi:hypothetical protein